MGIEFELKYAASPQTLAAIRDSLEVPFHAIRMQTTYYDTPDGDLSARRWTLRRRMENDVSVCTLKTPADDLGRRESECERGSIQEAVPVLCKLSGQDALTALARKGLVPICGARFTRLAATVETGGTLVEIALDAGVLTGGGREIPLCEVEVELKSGTRQDAMLYAAALEQKFGLIPEKKSKFRRALDLAGEG